MDAVGRRGKAHRVVAGLQVADGADLSREHQHATDWAYSRDPTGAQSARSRRAAPGASGGRIERPGRITIFPQDDVIWLVLDQTMLRVRLDRKGVGPSILATLGMWRGR